MTEDFASRAPVDSSRPNDHTEHEAGSDEATSRISRRSLLRAAVWTSVSSALLPLSALVTGPILARALGPVGRGEMAAVLAPMFVLVFVASMGVPDATVHAIAKLRAPVRRTVGSATLLLLFYGCVGAMILYLLSPVLLRQVPEAVHLQRMVIWTLPLLMVAHMTRFAVMGARRFRLASAERASAAFFRVVLLVSLFVAGLLNTKTAVWVNILFNMSTLVFLLVVLTRRSKNRRKDISGLTLVRKLAAFGVRGWGGVSANLIKWRIDQVFLGALTSASQIGYYAVAVSLAEVPSMMVGAMRNLLFAESAHRQEPQLVARVCRNLAALMVGPVVASLIIAPYVVRLLFGQAFEAATPMARILLLGSIPFSLEMILAAGLLSMGQPGRRSFGPIAAAVVTVIGLFVLVPALGAIGAAWVSLSAYTLNLLITAWLFSRSAQIPFRQIFIPRVAELRSVFEQLRNAVGRRRRPS